MTTDYLSVHEVHRTSRTAPCEVHALRGVSLERGARRALSPCGAAPGRARRRCLNVIGGLDRPDRRAGSCSTAPTSRR